MRLHIYILMTIALALCSCIPDLSQHQTPGEECIALTVYNSSMGTRADDPGQNNDIETERERLLSRLDIFLYPKGQTDKPCVFYKHLSGLGNVSGTEVVPIYVSTDVEEQLFPDDAVECDVYVVANLADSIKFKGNETLEHISGISVISKEFSQVISSDGSFVAPDRFVMSGRSVASKSGDSISGTVPLKRAASKVTMTILVPEYLMVKATNTADDTVRDERWHPYFVDPSDPTKGINTMHMGYHKGLVKTLVDGDNQRKLEDTFETLYTEDFTYVETIERVTGEGETAMIKRYFRYKCDISFYSYAFSWEGKDNDLQAPYFTLMLPWKRDEDERFTTYYYQVVVNGLSQKMERNTWYDISLNIGVLGSRVYNQPTILEDMSCYVLDWSEEIANNVHLNEWRYLVIPETYIEMNNTTLGSLPFEASHKVAWTLEWPGYDEESMDELEKYNQNNRYSAYYVNCNGKTPVSVQLSGVNNSSFSLSSDGASIDLRNSFPANVYSPIYYHLKVWLDLTPNGVLDADEQGFVEKVTFVQYPPIYIVPDQSAEHSVFVNGYNKYSSSKSAISYNNGKYVLAWCPGESDSGDHMYTINVSLFNADDTFVYGGEEYAYIIGDPRVTYNDINLNDDNFSMSDSWAEDVNGEKLEYYYPTAAQGDVFRVIAPSFRISSFLGGYSNGCTPEGAAMRCASYQEHGFPAGRWRLPTTAEIRFVISLQQKSVIQNIFYGSNYYYSSTDQVRNNSVTIDIKAITEGATGSVRCVYDEWYWGSEREAVPDNRYDGNYAFTWGDEPR